MRPWKILFLAALLVFSLTSAQAQVQFHGGFHYGYGVGHGGHGWNNPYYHYNHPYWGGMRVLPIAVPVPVYQPIYVVPAYQWHNPSRYYHYHYHTHGDDQGDSYRYSRSYRRSGSSASSSTSRSSSRGYETVKKRVKATRLRFRATPSASSQARNVCGMLPASVKNVYVRSTRELRGETWAAVMVTDSIARAMKTHGNKKCLGREFVWVADRYLD